MKTFLCVFFVATAALAMPHHGPGHHGGDWNHPSHPIAPGHGHGHGPHPPHPRPPQMPRELRELMVDLMDFQRLYPMEQLEQIIMNHWEDAELHATIDFMHSFEFENIMVTIGESPEFAAIGEYMENANWPWIHHVMIEAIETIEAKSRGLTSRNSGATGGLSALLDAVVAVLPRAELRALFDEKMETRATFRAVVEILTSDEMKGLLTNVKNSEVLREQFQTLATRGIDMEKVYTTTLAFFGL